MTEEPIKTIKVGPIERLFTVVPKQVSASGRHGLDPSRQTLFDADFVERRVGGDTGQVHLEIIRVPWSRAGPKGSHLDMRAVGVHHDNQRLDVFKIPLWLYSDAFNPYSAGGTLFPVNGTYWGMSGRT